jgi:hypothetical protein
MGRWCELEGEVFETLCLFAYPRISCQVNPDAKPFAECGILGYAMHLCWSTSTYNESF